MTYQDILEVVGERAARRSSANTNVGEPIIGEPIIGEPIIGTLATRTSPENPDHHLWNNRGTWWCHFTLHREDYTSERVRASLKTRDLDVARQRRDDLLKSVEGAER